MQTESPARPESIEADFLKHLPLVKQTIKSVCRRHRLPPAEEPDFAASVFVKLIDNDYAVFRRFRGQSGLRTFLFAVVYHHLLDLRNSEWGKWRPSARACQLGSAAVLLETLLVRDGVGLQEAIGTLVNHPRWQLSDRDVLGLYEQLETRAPRRRPDQAIDAVDAAVDATSETDLDLQDLRSGAHRARTALVDAIGCLDREERRLLRMRFQDGRTVIDIARATGTDAKALYRRFDRLFRRLRAELEQRDLTSSVVRLMVGHKGIEFPSALPQSGAVPV